MPAMEVLALSIGETAVLIVMRVGVAKVVDGNSEVWSPTAVENAVNPTADDVEVLFETPVGETLVPIFVVSELEPREVEVTQTAVVWVRQSAIIVPEDNVDWVHPASSVLTEAETD